MLNIAIVDDSKITCDFLNDVCYTYYHQKNQDVSIDIFFNGTLLLQSKKQYDIIFLDIELGIDNGIDVAQRLRKKDKQVLIVVISGYEKYKMSAYSIHCFDFLDKPISKEGIIKLLKEIDEYGSVDIPKESITLKTLQGTKKIYIDAIRYCEYKERKVFIYTLSQTYDLYIPLKELFYELKDKGFGMCHRSFIVNFKRIDLVHSQEIILDNQFRLPLSKSKKKEFIKQFKNYIKEI